MCLRYGRSRAVWLGALFLLAVAASLFPRSSGHAEDEPRADVAADAEAPDPQAALAAAIERDVTQGALRIVRVGGADGPADAAAPAAPIEQLVECPLTHTDVSASIAGYIARVRVTQTFRNPSDEPIEAVYVFPLPHEAAVDEMTLVVGERRIVGQIKRRADARAVYDRALLEGRTAALLEQERPNIFTQSVGNIDPGAEVRVEIAYVDVLRYDQVEYEFRFPMVVGPRYIPGEAIETPAARPAELEDRVSPPDADTNRVPDASRLNPPVLRPEFRSGHDVSLSVALDAGVPVQDLAVSNHETTIERADDRRATVALSPADSLPNKDFVLRYRVAGEKPAMAVLAHTGQYAADAAALGEGYFMLMVQPAADKRLEEAPPRELVFLVDVSGSMSGEPTAKVIEVMRQMLNLCRETDTVQVITFASQAERLFDGPLPATRQNIDRAVGFTRGLRGSGGTEMLRGVQMAINDPLDAERVRVVVMLTDGYIGNEAEIIEHVGQFCGDRCRFWCVGIGEAPNMFLVDGVARQGGGMGKTLGLEDDGAALATEVVTRIQRAQLAQLRIDWGGLRVAETHPARLPELWAGRPVIVFGRYAGGGAGVVTVSGSIEGEAASWPLEVELPTDSADHDVLAKVWARQKIESLMQQAYYADSPALEEEVTAVALDYRLMSQYTSFVAVDEQDAANETPSARPPRRMLVPVPLPAGTQWEGFFGGEVDAAEEVPMLLARVHPVADLTLNGTHDLRARSDLSLVISQTQERPLRRIRAGGGRALVSEEIDDGDAFAGANFGGGGGFGGGGFFGGASDEPTERAYFLSLAGTSGEMEPTPAWDATWRSLKDRDVPKIESALTAAMSAADAAQEAGEEPSEGSRLAHASLLDLALAGWRSSSGQTANVANGRLTVLHERQVALWTASLPALGGRLDLVLRDSSIADALAQIGRAGGVEVDLLPGSEDDAATLLARDDTRIAYLDVRGAALAEALDWLLLPARMTWRVEEGRIVAGTERRLAGESAWVYDVAAIALPTEEGELTGDREKRHEIARRAADAFRRALVKHLGVEEDAILWYAPGQLLLFADAATHARAAEAFAALADAEAKPPAALRKLHAATTLRAKDNRAAIEGQRTALRRLRTAAVLQSHGWQLLAEAAAGRFALESLTELQVVWRGPSIDELLAAEGRPLALRSAWQIAEAARLLPDEAELAALADAAAEKSRPAVSAAVKELAQERDDGAAIVGAIYAALARPDDADLAATALAALKAEGGEEPLAATAGALLPALLGGDAVDAAALDAALDGGHVEGEDLVVLTALACRRAGGDVWQAFRARSAALLGRQPLPGSVVLYVNRLEAMAYDAP